MNPHGSDHIMVPKDFIVPDHLKDAGILKAGISKFDGDCKIWCPRCRYQQLAGSPDLAADEGGEAAEGAAGGSGGGKAAKGADGGSGARSGHKY